MSEFSFFKLFLLNVADPKYSPRNPDQGLSKTDRPFFRVPV